MVDPPVSRSSNANKSHDPLELATRPRRRRPSPPSNPSAPQPFGFFHVFPLTAHFNLSLHAAAACPCLLLRVSWRTVSLQRGYRRSPTSPCTPAARAPEPSSRSAEAHVHAERSMDARAVETQKRAVIDARPVWVTRRAVRARLVASAHERVENASRVRGRRSRSETTDRVRRPARASDVRSSRRGTRACSGLPA